MKTFGRAERATRSRNAALCRENSPAETALISTARLSDTRCPVRQASAELCDFSEERQCQVWKSIDDQEPSCSFMRAAQLEH